HQHRRTPSSEQASAAGAPSKPAASTPRIVSVGGLRGEQAAPVAPRHAAEQERPEGEAGRRRFGGRALAVVALVAGLVGGLVGGVCVAWLAPDDSGSAVVGSGMVVGTDAPAGSAGSVADAAARALPSVVTIKVRGQQGSTGSGVIVRPDGYILTNAHVIAPAANGAGEIVVIRYQDVTEIPAQLVGQDPKTDLAVIRINVDGQLPAATLGRSSSLRVGTPVIAIGAPLDLQGSVSTGIVSALDRSQSEPTGGGGSSQLSAAIQTDAAINPGSSGGALVDGNGQVVGINTAIASVPGAPAGDDGQTGSIGVGFAIPIDYARSIADEIIQTGHATHPYLGISAATVTQTDAAATGRVPGALVRELDPSGPAAAAGLRVGDVVTKIDDVVVSGANELLETARRHHVGDRVTVRYQRAGRDATAQVTLTEQKN
ncbi:trypsin-like peptidase domain-containing protein, partial [Pseudofrankia sp. BMG5.36]|uniref:S1C family serine protease n=2 Tax=unclassified Pseudofrankia TaxID=2994372 RepID=UPI001F5261E5